MNNSFSIAIVSILISNIHSTEINQLPDIKQSSDMKQISYIKKIHI